jgi:hypothetical protein
VHLLNGIAGAGVAELPEHRNALKLHVARDLHAIGLLRRASGVAVSVPVRPTCGTGAGHG